MAYTLNTTLADVAANSYVDLAYANDYWARHYSSVKSAAWDALDDDPKTSLLIQACRVLETVRFTIPVSLHSNYHTVYDRRSHLVLDLNLDNQTPIKYYFYQLLQFPRNFDRDIITGALYIPEPVLMAQCEQALYILTFDDSVIATKLQGVDRESVTLGTIQIKQNIGGMGTTLAPMAYEMLKPYMLKMSGSLRRA